LHKLYRWNLFNTPCQGETLEQVIQTVMSTFLYDPLVFEMSHEALYPWGTKQPGLAIPFGWLSCAELETVKFIHVNRLSLFKRERRLPADPDKFHLSEYMHPLQLCIQHRRELLRDFVGLCMLPHKKSPELQVALHYALLLAAQTLCQEQVRGRVDAFLMPLNRYLTGFCEFEHVLTTDLTGDVNRLIIYDP
jgi:hypothetical protein